MSKNGSTLTVGGVTVQRPNGKMTIAAPVAQYVDLTDQDLADFWDWLENDGEAQQLQAAYQAGMAQRLVAFGKRRNKIS